MKYIIELEDEPMIANSFNQEVDELWKAKGFNSLVFDKYGLYKLTPYTESDREAIEIEVWDFVRSAFWNMTQEDIDQCYDGWFPNSYQETKAKYDAWKKRKDEIHVGDEVISTFGDKMVVTHHWNQNDGTTGVSGFSADCSGLYYDEIEVEKTGRHFPEVEELLKKLVGEQND